MVYAPVDAFETLSGRRSPGMPPRGLRFVGAGDFVEVGEEFRDRLLADVQLKPSSDVLDIGCGIGRLALPLTEVLSAEGSYHGFDVWKPAIRWGTRHITRRHPNFRFSHLDAHNPEYNPSGLLDAATAEFPVEDAQFDLATALSVYTHLLQASTERYFAETARALRPGGLAFSTFFLLNDASRELANQGRGVYRFEHEQSGAFVDDPTNPEAAVAHDEAFVLDGLRAVGLEPISVQYGAWCGREEHHSFQDIVIVQKAAS